MPRYAVYFHPSEITSDCMLRQGTPPPFVTTASPFRGSLSSRERIGLSAHAQQSFVVKGFFIEVCVPPSAHSFVDKVLRLMDCAYCMWSMALHTASERSATIFFFPLADSVEWHVVEGDKVEHLKHIVTVRRKACRRLQLESHFLFVIKDSRDACATGSSN